MRKVHATYAAALMALAGSLAGCSATSPPVRRQAAKPAFSINGGTACIPTPASPATKDPNAWFVQARKEWKLGEETDAADVGLCWEKAALDLNSIGSIQAPGINGFATAARELQRLTLLPDSMETAAQMAEGQNLIRRLNAFFGTKGGYGVAASTPTTTTTSPSKQLPISVESDNQMQAAGNLGPSSSILIPVSCEQTGTTITAKGTYQGGFAPNLYNRYGDIVELYVFGASFTGYPQGPQLAASSAKDSPAIGGYGSWRVSTTVNLAGYEPARCVIAAQPTHDLQSAP